MNALRPYVAIVSARFRLLLQYRAAAFAGFATQLFWGLIRLQIFDAFYASSDASQPLTREQMVSYVWLGQAFFALLPVQVDNDVRNLVRQGDIAQELLRPVDLYGLLYARAIASRTAPVALRAGPLLLLAWLFFGLEPPPTLLAAASWVLALGGALLVGCAFMTLCTVFLIWTVAPDGVARWMPQLTYVFSGMILPVPFFPAWARPVIEALPFRGMFDLPARVYSGEIPNVLPVLGHQLAWTAALVVAGRLLLARSVRRIEIAGG